MVSGDRIELPKRGFMPVISQKKALKLVHQMTSATLSNVGTIL